MDERTQDRQGTTPPPVSLLQTMKAVAWSFFGVRRSADHERDMARLKPQVVIAAGVLGALIFVLLLIALVRFVVSSGVAA